MFDNMVHISYTWDNMCLQGSKDITWGKGGEEGHISLVSKPNVIL
jgi:hypothetical protein